MNLAFVEMRPSEELLSRARQLRKSLRKIEHHTDSTNV